MKILKKFQNNRKMQAKQFNLENLEHKQIKRLGKIIQALKKK